MRIYKYIIISVILIAALTFNSYAAEPVDNLSIPIMIDIDGTTYGETSYNNLRSGQMLYAYFITPSNWTLATVGSDIDLRNYSSSDVYLCYFTTDEFYWSINTFLPYRDTSGDTSFEWHNDSIIFTFTSNNTSISYTTTINTSPTNYYITAEFYNDVPAGQYMVRRRTKANASKNLDFAFGVYIYTEDQKSAYDEFIDGSISFEEAIDKINQQTNNNVESAPDLTAKLVALSIGEKQIQEIVQASNNKSLNNIQDVFTPALDNITQSFENGTIDLDAAMNDSYTSYTNSLNAADTPEQGTLVNTTYNNHLKNLELRAQIRIRNMLLSIITDDDIKKADDYYAAEKELIDKFDIEEFNAQLDFDRWLMAIPSNERYQYRRFFEYILNESQIRNFILIPMFLGLISIILGTRIHVFGIGKKDGDRK